MPKLIIVITSLILVASQLSAAEINLDLLKRMAVDREKSNQFFSEGKPLKANALWDQVNNKLQSTYKSGAWYTLPPSCAALRRSYSDRIQIECKISDLAAKDLTVPEIDLKFVAPNLSAKWEDVKNEVQYDIKFKVAKYRDVNLLPFKIGYVHTNITGFTLYIDAFQILAKRKIAEEAQSLSEEDAAFREKMAIMIREINPMLSTLDLKPEKLSSPKSCVAPKDTAVKNALMEMEKIVREKSLPLETADLMKIGSFEMCNMANKEKADDACLDACMEKVFEAWK
ncbi:MAG: hypothetical protein KF713_18935 [Turneriella sp.]|nr:hypothetical protein [Turneriella sp.]